MSQEFFDQLPGNYREAINKEIRDSVGEEEPEIVAAFREWEARALLECEINESDDLTKNEFGTDFGGFLGGWRAREEKAQGTML